MVSGQETIKFSALTDDITDAIAAFNKLSTDDKLGWFYLIYEKMGSSVTPAAPAATDPELAPLLLGDFYNLSDSEQLGIMRDIVNCKDTPYSRAYGALSDNNRLMVWYAWAQGMDETVVGLPEGYQAAQPIQDLLGKVENLGFQKQISMFRQIASDMGFSEVQPLPTQAETGKTSSL